MKLGTLIKQLEAMPQDASVEYDFGYMIPTKLDSWRGRYECLAIGYTHFETIAFGDRSTVKDLVEKCKEAVGKTYEGYKGGDYRMTEDTEVWVDNYGEYSNTALVGIGDQWGTVILITQKVST